MGKLKYFSFFSRKALPNVPQLHSSLLYLPRTSNQATYSLLTNEKNMVRSSLHKKPRTDDEARSLGLVGSPPTRNTGGRGGRSSRSGSYSPRSPAVSVDAPIGDSTPFKLYIAHVHGHIPSKMIFSVFRKLGLGKLSQGDTAIQLIPRKARKAGQRDYQSVIISFDHPFLRGRDAPANADMLNHIVKLGPEGELVPTQTFQLVYQEARTNHRTGREEPDRHWDIRFWTEQAPNPRGRAAAGRPKVTLVSKAKRRANAPPGLQLVPPHPGPIPADLASNPYGALATSPASPAYSPNSPEYSRQDAHSPDYSPTTPPAPVTAAPDGLAALDAAVITGTPSYDKALDALAADPDQDEVIAAIEAEQTAELERPGIHAEAQAVGDEMTAEYEVAATGAGNIHGSDPQPEDLLMVGVAHPYAEPGTTQFVAEDGTPLDSAPCSREDGTPLDFARH